MNRFRQLISGYLAFTIVAAGVVGLSPLLHTWIEHGGHGPHHSHLKPLRHAPKAPQRVLARKAFAHSIKPFTIPGLGRFQAALSNCLQRLASKSRPATDGEPEHEHHSLAQLLANGLIDVSFVGAPLIPERVSADCIPVCVPPFLLAASNAELPGRGPPSTLS